MQLIKSPRGTQLGRLKEVIERKERFTFDIRSNCQVYFGIVCAYRATRNGEHFLDLPAVIAHAMEHDGIVGGWLDPKDRKVYYVSCRVFTDLDQAVRFAQTQKQRSVFNLNRGCEIAVVHDLQQPAH